jgi:hypothetical protein
MVELQDVNGRASCNLPAITSLGVDPCLHIVHATGSLLQGVPASAFRTEELARLCALLVSCILDIHFIPKSHAHYLENFVWDGRDPAAIFSGAQSDLILSHLISAPLRKISGAKLQSLATAASNPTRAAHPKATY